MCPLISMDFSQAVWFDTFKYSFYVKEIMHFLSNLDIHRCLCHVDEYCTKISLFLIDRTPNQQAIILSTLFLVLAGYHLHFRHEKHSNLLSAIGFFDSLLGRKR